MTGDNQELALEFAQNPLLDDEPIILMPSDILRDLPIAVDWSEVQESTNRNSSFRRGLNKEIFKLWSKKILENKDNLKRWALSNPSAFGDLLDILHGMDGKPYDFISDPKGEIAWRTAIDRVISRYDLQHETRQATSYRDVVAIVDTIIDRFKHYVEDRDLWRELYTTEQTPRIEKAAQRLFYLLAASFCEANDLDITPEAETGAGPVDFKVSFGMSNKVIIEIKMSGNIQLVKGYEKQIVAYAEGEGTRLVRYVVINVGSINRKFEKITSLYERQRELNKECPIPILIDGRPKVSASNR